MTKSAVGQVANIEDNAGQITEQAKRKYTRPRISHDEMKWFNKEKESRRYLSKSDREAANFGDAVFLDQIKGLRFVPGQHIKVTDQDAGLHGAKAVVLGDYERYVLLELVNKHGDERKLTLLKADILRGWSGDKLQRGRRVKIELH